MGKYTSEKYKEHLMYYAVSQRQSPTRLSVSEPSKDIIRSVSPTLLDDF